MRITQIVPFRSLTIIRVWSLIRFRPSLSQSCKVLRRTLQKVNRQQSAIITHWKRDLFFPAQGKFGQLPKTQLTMRSMNTQNSIQQRQSPPSSWSSVEGGRKEALFCKLPANLTIKPAFQKESTSMTSARKRCSGFAEEASSDQKQTMPTHPTFRTKSINHEKPCTLILSPLATKRAAVTEKSDLSKRSIRSITIELIERNPALHLGVSREYLPVLKDTICKMAGVELTDMYLTIKKLKHNEDFALLGEYFEMKETTVQEVFTRSLVKLARYMRYLAMWPSDQSYYTRHKNVPLHFRRNMTNVQSVVECVETDMRTPLHVDCCNFKFILCINTSSEYFGGKRRGINLLDQHHILLAFASPWP